MDEEYLEELFDYLGYPKEQLGAFKKGMSTDQDYNKQIFEYLGYEGKDYDAFKSSTGLSSKPTQDVKKKDLSDSTPQTESTELASEGKAVSSSELEKHQDTRLSDVSQPKEVKLGGVLEKIDVPESKKQEIRNVSKERIQQYKQNKGNKFFEGENVGGGFGAKLLQGIDYISGAELFNSGFTKTAEEEYSDVVRAYDKAKDELKNDGISESNTEYNTELDDLAQSYLVSEKTSSLKEQNARKVIEDMSDEEQNELVDYAGNKWIDKGEDFKKSMAEYEILTKGFVTDLKLFNENKEEYKQLKKRIKEIKSGYPDDVLAKMSSEERSTLQAQYGNVYSRLVELEDVILEQSFDLNQERDFLLDKADKTAEKNKEKLSSGEMLTLVKKNYGAIENLGAKARVAVGRLGQIPEAIGLTQVDFQKMVLDLLPENSKAKIAGDAFTSFIEEDLAEGLSEKISYQRDFEELYAKPYTLDEVEDFSDIMYLGGNALAENFISLSVAGTTGVAAPFMFYSMGVSDKRAQIQEQKNENPLFRPTPLQSFTSSQIAGASEATLGLIGTIRNVRAAKSAVKGTKAINKFKGFGGYAKHAGEELFKGGIGEASEELGIAVVDATNDFFLLGDKKSFDRMKSNASQIAFSSAFIGSATRGAPHTIGMLGRVYGSAKSRMEMRKNSKRIKSLSENLMNKNLSDDKRKLISDEILSLIVENEDFLASDLMKLNGLSSGERNKIADIYYKTQQLRKKNNDLKKDKNIKEETKKQFLNKFKAEARKLLDEKELILEDVQESEVFTETEQDTETEQKNETKEVETEDIESADNTVTTLDIDKVSQDPKRFQYKSDVDENTGVSDKLKGRKFNRDVASTISVWVDPNNGETYVINGHHRLDLAKSSGEKQIDVKYIKAENAQQARTIGAIQNIAEGMGTDIDAAKVFRDADYSMEELESYGLSITDAKTRKGLALSSLSDALFGLVTTGKMKPNVGVIIGETIKSKDIQEQFYNKIKNKNYNNSTIKIMAEDMNSAPKTKESVSDLFGTTEKETADFEQRSKFIASVGNVISRAKNFLAKTAKGKDFLEEYGNKIDEEKSKGASQEASIASAVFSTLRNSNQEIKTLIDKGVERIKNGENQNKVINETAKQIIEKAESIYKGGKKKDANTRSKAIEDAPKVEDKPKKTTKQKPIADSSKDYEEARPTPDKKINYTKDKQKIFDGFESGLNGILAKDVKDTSLAYKLGNRLGRLAKAKGRQSGLELKREISNLIKDNLGTKIGKADLKKITGILTNEVLSKAEQVSNVFDVITEANRRGSMIDLIRGLNKRLKIKTKNKSGKETKAKNVDVLTDFYIEKVKSIIDGFYTKTKGFTEKSLVDTKKVDKEIDDINEQLNKLNDKDLSVSKFEKKAKALVAKRNKKIKQAEKIHEDRDDFFSNIDALSNKADELENKGTDKSLFEAMAIRMAIHDTQNLLDADINELGGQIETIYETIDKGKAELAKEVEKEHLRLKELNEKMVGATETERSKMTDNERDENDRKNREKLTYILKNSAKTLVDPIINAVRNQDMDDFRTMLFNLDHQKNELFNGVMFTYFYKNNKTGVQQKENRYNQAIDKSRAEVRKAFRDIFEITTKQGFLNVDAKIMNKEVSTVDIIDSNGSKINLHMSLAELMSLYVKSLSKENSEKLRYAGFITESFKQLDELMKKYPKVKEMGDWMIEFIKKKEPEYQKAYKARNRTYFDTFENYFPSKVNTNEISVKEDVDSNKGNKLSNISPHLIRRTKNRVPEDLKVNAFKALDEYLVAQEKQKEYGGFIKDINSLLSNQEFRKNLKVMSGGNTRLIRNFTNASKRVIGISTTNIMPDSVSKWESIISLTRLFGNFYSAIKQYTSVLAVYGNTPMTRKIPFFSNAARITQKLARRTASASIESIMRAWEKSPAYRDRILEVVFPDESVSYSVGNRKVTKTLASKYSISDFRKLLLAGNLLATKITDASTVAIVWDIQYSETKEKLIKDGYTDKKFIEERAIQDADYTVTLQQSNKKSDISSSQEKGNPLSMFNRFMNQPKINTRLYAASALNIARRYSKNKEKYKGNKSKAFRALLKDHQTRRDVVRMLFYTHLQQAFFAALSVGFDLSDEENLEHVIYNTILAPIYGYTFFSNISQGFAYWMPQKNSGKKTWASLPSDVGATIPAAEIFGQDLSEIFRVGQNEGKSSANSIFVFATILAEYGASIPVRSMLKSYEAFRDMHNNGVKPSTIARVLKAPKSIWMSLDESTEEELLKREAELLGDENTIFKLARADKIDEIREFKLDKAKAKAYREANSGEYDYFNVIGSSSDGKDFNKFVIDAIDFVIEITKDKPISSEQQIKILKSFIEDVRERGMSQVSKTLESKRTNKEKVNYLIQEVGVPNEDNKEQWITMIEDGVISENVKKDLIEKYIILKNIDEIIKIKKENNLELSY